MHQINNIITTYHPYVIYTQGLDFITFIVFLSYSFFNFLSLFTKQQDLLKIFSNVRSQATVIQRFYHQFEVSE